MLAVPPTLFAKTIFGYRCSATAPTSARWIWGDLVAVVGRASAKEPAWGLGLMWALADHDVWNEELWNRLLQGCGGAKFNDDEWRRLFEFFDGFSAKIRTRDSACQLLLDCVGRQENPIPEALLESADRASRHLWEACLNDEPEETEDWLDRAVNRPAGKLARFWMHIFSRRRDAHHQRPPLSVDDRRFFATVVHIDTFAGALARTIFVGTLPFMMSVDAEFTECELVPLLDWKRNEDHALQSWQGLIYWARWLPIVEKLQPFLRDTFERLNRFPKNYRDALAGRIAHLTLFGYNDPWTDGFLSNYIERVSESERCEFACVFEQQLEVTPSEQLESVWERWLRTYVDSRTRGIPLPMSPGESQAMLNWGLHLRPVFAEFADILEKTEIKVEYSGPFICGLVKSDLPVHASHAVAKLLMAVLQNDIVYDWDDVGKIVRALIEHGAPRGELITICDQLARLGCPSARELYALIPPKD
jgi:hypothetical protein